MSDFGEVRSLLHDAEPSREAFERLLDMFRHAEDSGEAERVWVPYALEHLEAWPDATREVALGHEFEHELESASWLLLARRVLAGKGGWPAALFREFVHASTFAGVRSFEVHESRVPEELMGWIASSPHARQLEELTVGVVRVGDALEALAESDLLLKRLIVRGSFATRGGDRGLEALASSPMVETLHALTLSSCRVGRSGVRAMGGAHAGQLRELDLSFSVIDGEDIEALAWNPTLPGFTSLHLDGCPIGDVGLIALADSGCLEGVSVLGLRRVGLGHRGVEALARSVAVETLGVLDVGQNELGSRGAAALASASWPALDTLDLNSNPLGERGIVEVLRSAGMSVLTWLDLGACTSEESLELEGPTLDHEERAFPEDRSHGEGLRWLNLAFCDLSVPAMRALAETRRVVGVSELDLSFSGFGDEGAIALFADSADERFGSLTTLSVTETGLTDASARVFANLEGAPLRELHADRNAVGREWLESLTNSTSCEALEVLRLRGCGFGDEGIEVLARATRMAALRVLDIGDAGGGEVGLSALVEAPWMKTLEELHADGNAWTSGVMSGFASSPEELPLQSLEVGRVRCDDEVWNTLAMSPVLRNLSRITPSNRNGVELFDVWEELIERGVVLNPWASDWSRSWRRRRRRSG